MKRWLDEEVYHYTDGDAYPFHIPGAKRVNVGLTASSQSGSERGDEWSNPFRYDITEIGGFDDLRHASGLLAELEREWAKMYGAGAALLSVNGSTCGNLATIFAATKQHDRILVADGCHWSVRNAAELRELSVEWLPVERSAEGFCEAVAAEAVEREFSEGAERGAGVSADGSRAVVPDDEHRAVASETIECGRAAESNGLEKVFSEQSGIQAVVITSPTYEGLVADVPRIAEIVHSHGAVLVVDSAHGAHLGLRMGERASDIFSFSNPITQGADAVVVSLHKTLPVLGQVSLILLSKEQVRVRADEVKRYLNMFQTSSPSYLLMSSAAAGCRFLQEQGAERYREYARLLVDFYERTSGLKLLHILKKDNQDLSKIIISTKDVEISGQKLMKLLREDYHLELEKAGENYALAVTSVMDIGEGFQRLADALNEIDKGLMG